MVGSIRSCSFGVVMMEGEEGDCARRNSGVQGVASEHTAKSMTAQVKKMGDANHHILLIRATRTERRHPTDEKRDVPSSDRFLGILRCFPFSPANITPYRMQIERDS